MCFYEGSEMRFVGAFLPPEKILIFYSQKQNNLSIFVSIESKKLALFVRLVSKVCAQDQKFLMRKNSHFNLHIDSFDGSTELKYLIIETLFASNFVIDGLENKMFPIVLIQNRDKYLDLIFYSLL